MKKKRNVYLDMKTLAEAREILFSQFPTTGRLRQETVEVVDAVGRTLAKPVSAAVSSPGFHSAAMDGIAVNAQDTFGASEARPKTLIIGSDAFYVNTGHVLPPGTNAVVMIEKINVLDEHRVVVESAAFPWQHVRKTGEDIVATELLFPSNHEVTPYCIGALLAGGIFSVSVREKPKVLIIPTGSELVDIRQASGRELGPGQVTESNSYVLGKLTEAYNGIFQRCDIIKDDLNKIRQAVREGVDGDFQVVLIVGGSSAGSEDYARDVIAGLGRVLVHGVTIMPGKPLIIGAVDSKPVFGIPGYPVSAIIAFEQFVGPLLCRLLGRPDRERTAISVKPTRKIASKLGVEEFLRVKLGLVGDRVVATPLARGAGLITSITEADGIIRIPNHVEGINAGEPAEAELLRPLSAVRNTIVAVGSHDNTLDVIADLIKAQHGHLSLSSSHVGSMGGLMALRQGGCHLAGSHLLDARDGSYNVSYLKKYLPDISVRLVNLVYRDQGLIVLPGNPRKIKGIEDLVRDDIRFINRQGGSGTRILLDYRLKQLNIDPDGIRGYRTEEFTHMSVAVAVLSGTADVGLGIYAAARALNLEFIPVVTEQYDLVIPQIHFDSEPLRILLDTIRSDVFKNRVLQLGGYSTAKTGEVII